MKKYILFNDFCKFYLINNCDIEINKLEEYFYTYINIKECLEKENDNEIVLILESENSFNNNIYDEQYAIESHKLCIKDKNIILFLKKNDVLFLKRLIIDIMNRIIETKGGRFFHGATVVKDGKSIIFTGDKMSGKTTNMLLMLNENNFNYLSNEKVALIKQDNNIYTYGCPSNINVRVGTLEYNNDIYNRLKECINTNGYKTKLKHLDYTKEDRLVFTASELSESFEKRIEPIGIAQCICNLVFLPDVDFLMRELSYKEKLIMLKKSLISGVYPTREDIINKIFIEDKKMKLDDFSNIKCYNIFHNNTKNNVNRILTRVKEDLK